ncbi:MAG: hypothetical protein RL018_1716 [Pseudomonadota bacterium]|jgi:hypothetical protein
MAKTASLGNKTILISVIALLAIEHDGIRYEEGEQFNLPPKAVQPLADVNAIKVIGEVEVPAEEATALTGDAAAPDNKDTAADKDKTKTKAATA